MSNWRPVVLFYAFHNNSILFNMHFLMVHLKRFRPISKSFIDPFICFVSLNGIFHLYFYSYLFKLPSCFLLSASVQFFQSISNITIFFCLFVFDLGKDTLIYAWVRLLHNLHRCFPFPYHLSLSFHIFQNFIYSYFGIFRPFESFSVDCCWFKCDASTFDIFFAH